MTQHQIRIMNQPEPSSEELYVKKICETHARARGWAEQALASGLEELLFPGDRPALKELIRQVRARRLLSADGRDAVADIAVACASRIARLVDPDSPGSRARAQTLTAHELELHTLAAAIDEVLDLENALQGRHRISM